MKVGWDLCNGEMADKYCNFDAVFESNYIKLPTNKGYFLFPWLLTGL